MAPRGALRPVLWFLLLTSAALNVGTSVTVGAASAGFGLVALACIAALIAHHYRHRR